VLVVLLLSFSFSLSVSELSLFLVLFTHARVWTTSSYEIGSSSSSLDIYMDVSHPYVCTDSKTSSGKKSFFGSTICSLYGSSSIIVF
jgi:hypothetical protein